MSRNLLLSCAWARTMTHKNKQKNTRHLNAGLAFEIHSSGIKNITAATILQYIMTVFALFQVFGFKHDG